MDKILMLAVVAGLLLGPETLPKAAHYLGVGLRKLRAFADESTTRLRSEAGPAIDEVDWRKLDPRQYDPRRIIREALLDDADPPVAKPDRGL